MKRHIFTILFSSVFVLSSCSNQELKNNTLSEPMPPDPFPIELSTVLSVYSVDVENKEALIKLIMTVNRNTELHRNVKLQYKIYSLHDGKQTEKLTKTILDEEIDLYVKKEMIEDIYLTDLGKYKFEIDARSWSWGQNKSFTLRLMSKELMLRSKTGFIKIFCKSINEGRNHTTFHSRCGPDGPWFTKRFRGSCI